MWIFIRSDLGNASLHFSERSSIHNLCIKQKYFSQNAGWYNVCVCASTKQRQLDYVMTLQISHAIALVCCKNVHYTPEQLPCSAGTSGLYFTPQYLHLCYHLQCKLFKDTKHFHKRCSLLNT